MCKLIDRTNKNFCWNNNMDGEGYTTGISTIAWDKYVDQNVKELSVRKVAFLTNQG